MNPGARMAASASAIAISWQAKQTIMMSMNRQRPGVAVPQVVSIGERDLLVTRGIEHVCNICDPWDCMTNL